jgi:adenylate cyclase
MPKLTATGAEPLQYRSVDVSAGQTIRLGRAPKSGWEIPWELMISREHADLSFRGGSLRVSVLDSARNACVYDGKSSRQFDLAIGEEFRVGATHFALAADESDLSQTVGSAVLEQVFNREDLRKFSFDNAGDRLEMLAGLPQIIADSRSDVDLATRLVDLLIEAIPPADAAAVVVMPTAATPNAATPSATMPAAATRAEIDTGTALAAESLAEEGISLASDPTTIRWTSRRAGAQFRPSRQLIAAALQRGQSLLHIWEGGEAVQFTRSADLDWAFCVPISGEACRGWILYVSGKFGISSIAAGASDSLKGHIRFTELLAQFISAIRQVRRLEQRHTAISRFFSPAVADKIVDPNFDIELAPKEGPVSVLFCDLRGFSQQAERSRHQLREFLARVSEALGIMTSSVLAEQGVIADFQGDAVLAFWGWPTPLADGPLAACRAALAIRQRFANAAARSDPALAGFDVGIGIAHGSAIAGKLGTDEQIKIGVFGPVVNLASRLQSLTHQFGVTIVIDPATAEFVRASLPHSVGRQRTLAHLRPKGLATDVLVSELLPPEAAGVLTDRQIELHDAAVVAFTQGDWAAARQFCTGEAHSDGARDFLLRLMTQHNFTAPADWDGVVTLKEK